MQAYQMIMLIVVLMSVITFALFGIDKWKAVHRRWRISEAALLLSAFILGSPGALLGMFVFHHKVRKWKFRILVPLFAVFQVIILAFFLWTADYYRADSDAASAMESDAAVSVEQTGSGWLFDGPSEDTACIFYPGAKVEETAYAPLLRSLAENGMDVYLEKMPCHLAFFGKNRASTILKNSSYDHYFIGGHSLGGVVAADYASGHTQELDGVILLAAYPAKKLEDGLTELLIYGSEDRVLNRERLEEADVFAPSDFTKYRIEGGNHARFGNYGAQKGDGTAAVSWQEQQAETVNVITGKLMASAP